jgi:predicted nucleotidyltransferase
MNNVQSMPYGLPRTAVQKIKAQLAQHKNISQAILYGSRAKGCAKTGSDIDLALVGDEHLDFDTLCQIKSELDDLMLPWQVDVAILRDIEDAEVRAHIQRVGQVFYRA